MSDKERKPSVQDYAEMPLCPSSRSEEDMKAWAQRMGGVWLPEGKQRRPYGSLKAVKAQQFDIEDAIEQRGGHRGSAAA